MHIRRLLLVSALFIMLLGAISPAQAQSLGSYDAYVFTALLPLRDGPSTSANQVALLQNGDRMNFDGRNAASDWLHITTEYNQVGWAYIRSLFIADRSRANIPNLPILAGNPAGGTTGGKATPIAPTPTQPAGALPLPPASSAKGGRFELGGQVQYLDGSAISAMQRAGMRWVKQQVSVGGGADIGSAHGNGFKILLSVVGDKNSLTTDAYQDQFASFVGGLAAQGADGIEVGNEMNIDREWPAGQINPATYVNLLATAYTAIKRANPGTLVITGAPAPTGAEGAYGLDRVWNDDRYVRGMAAAGAGRYADCVGIHYNEGIVSPTARSGDPRGSYPTRYFSAMLARGLSGFSLPACFTELGFLSPEGYGPLPGSFSWASNTTVAQQAAWLAQAAASARASGRVRLMIVFNVNFTGYGEDPQGGYAMIRPGGGCPACDALGRVTR